MNGAEDVTIGNIRDDFPSLTECVHLNSAGISPMPRCVYEELSRLPTYVFQHGPTVLLKQDESVVRNRDAHQTLASFLGVDVDEVAFTSSFSNGVSLVLEGLTFRPGDEIVISNQEHPALLIPLLNLAQRRDLVIRKFPVSFDPEVVLSSLARLLTPRTRMVAVSHVTTEDGTRLPAREVTRLAHQNDSFVLFDGAQSLGQFPVNLHDLGCDFYAFLGYKWLYGPFTSAALYIKRDVLDQVQVTWTGSRANMSSSADTIDMDSFEFKPGAQRFEFGGRPWAEESAMAVGVDYVTRLGLENVEKHAREMAQYLHLALASVPGARIHSPTDPEQMTGIVTFSVDGVSGEELSEALLQRWNILTRSALKKSSVRTSMAAFTSYGDLDLLVKAVASVAAGK